MTTTEPGVIVTTDMPDPKYRAVPALSSSGAKKLLPPSCPALFKWERDHPPESRPVFDVGHAAHQLVLGAGQPITRLDFEDWRTNAAKEARQQVYDAGAVPLLAKDYSMVVAMADALSEHPIVGGLFDPDRGDAELSIFWTDDDAGIDRKARLDWLTTTANGRPLVVDYKSTASAEPTAFGKSVANFGYERQGAWYVDAAAAAGYEDAAFLLVAQEKTPPYLVTVFELDFEAMSIGRAMNARAMEVYVDCTARDVWPGYSDSIELVSLPSWASSRAWSA